MQKNGSAPFPAETPSPAEPACPAGSPSAMNAIDRSVNSTVT